MHRARLPHSTPVGATNLDSLRTCVAAGKTIGQAAVACDFGALSELAAGDDQPFTYDSWDADPEEDSEALRPLYDDDLASFDRFGSYLGYRLSLAQYGECALRDR